MKLSKRAETRPAKVSKPNSLQVHGSNRINAVDHQRFMDLTS